MNIVLKHYAYHFNAKQLSYVKIENQISDFKILHFQGTNASLYYKPTILYILLKNCKHQNVYFYL